MHTRAVSIESRAYQVHIVRKWASEAVRQLRVLWCDPRGRTWADDVNETPGRDAPPVSVLLQRHQHLQVVSSWLACTGKY